MINNTNDLTYTAIHKGTSSQDPRVNRRHNENIETTPVDTISSSDKDPGKVDNTRKNSSFIKNIKNASTGAAIGAVVGAGIGLATPAGALGACIGGPIGGVVGGLIGNKFESLAYDAKAAGKWIHNAGQAVFSFTAKKANQLRKALERVLHTAGLTEKRPAPLTLADLKGVDRTGETKRKYDGYDSSRDIFALYAREGDKDEKYRFQIETAHLRPGASWGNLNAYLAIDWGTEGKPGPLPFGLENNEPADSWKMAIEINHRDSSKIIDNKGKQIADKADDVYFSNTFSNIQFSIDKEHLRNMGWKDGQPLRLKAMTTRDGENEVADSLKAQTDAAPGELADSLFR